jgi:predicted XRE-type DNA-binding protein
MKDKLKNIRRVSKEEIKSKKNKIMEVVDNAENAIMVFTDHGQVFIGNGLDIRATLCMAFSEIMNRKIMTDEEIIELVKIARFTNNNSLSSLNKIAEGIEELINKLGE